MWDAGVERIQKDLEEMRKSGKSIVETLERDIVKSKYVISTLANVLEDGLIVLDSAHLITVINGVAASFFGYTHDMAIGKSLKDLHPDVFGHDDSINHEWVIHDLVSGLPRYLDTSVSTITTPETNEQMHILIIRDVTFKKSNEFKIVDLSSFQYNLISSIPVPTFYTDTNGGYIRGSQSFYEFVGESRVKTLSKTTDDLFHLSVSKRIKDLRISNDIFGCTIQTSLGERRVIVYKNVLKSADGNTLGLICCVVDVNQVKVTDEISDIVLRTLESCPDPLCLFAYPSGEIILVNKAFVQEYGYSKIEASTLTLKELATNYSEYKSSRKRLIKSMRAECTMKSSFEIKRKDGTTVYEHFSFVPVVGHGKHKAHHCLISRD